MASSPSARRVLGLVRPYWLPLLVSSLLVTLGAGVALIAPRVAGSVVDTAIDATRQQESLQRLNQVALLLVGLFLLRGLLSFADTYLLRATGFRMLRDFRDRLYSHLVSLAPDFFEKERIGELLSRIGSDVAQIQSTFTSSIPDGVRAIIVFLGTIAMLLSMNVSMTILTLVIVPPIVVISVLFGRRLGALSKRIQDRLADTTASAEETIAGIQTVQAYSGERAEAGRYRNLLEKLLHQQLRSARLAGAFLGSLQFFGFSAFAVVLWYGGRLILAGELTVGELTAFLLYVFAIAGSVSSLGSLYSALRTVRDTAARTFEILETQSSIEEPAGAITLSKPRGGISFRGVSYRYPSADEDRWALRHVDLELRAGETVALVGPSGAGKTTLLGLLLRFRDPTEGMVLLDDIDLRALSVDNLRRTMAVVQQDVFLFSGSIADNIRYSKPDATDTEIRAAARAAGAAEFIERIAQGYDSIVGERGVKLSAGQRQRIAIARAFLREPRILLLDEATSALDAESEHIVQQALSRLMNGRTTLIIAHRLTTARRADRIIVLDSGTIVAAGTHDELHASSEMYRRFWELQTAPGVEA